jgi:hypothetical protein
MVRPCVARRLLRVGGCAVLRPPASRLSGYDLGRQARYAAAARIVSTLRNAGGVTARGAYGDHTVRKIKAVQLFRNRERAT